MNVAKKILTHHEGIYSVIIVKLPEGRLITEHWEEPYHISGGKSEQVKGETWIRFGHGNSDVLAVQHKFPFHLLSCFNDKAMCPRLLGTIDQWKNGEHKEKWCWKYIPHGKKMGARKAVNNAIKKVKEVPEFHQILLIQNDFTRTSQRRVEKPSQTKNYVPEADMPF